MNENMDILLAMGGLVHGYMTRKYPVVDDQSLDIKTWRNVVNRIPCLAIGDMREKKYTDRIAGVKVSGELLEMIALAVITEGASLIKEFQAFLKKVGDATFSVQSKAQRYQAVTCSYLSYLQDNTLGGYFDWGALVLREIYFNAGFQEFNGVSVKAQAIQIDMRYNEYVNIVQLRRLRTGGDSSENWKALIKKETTKQFEDADNFFNGGDTPQDDIKPQIT